VLPRSLSTVVATVPDGTVPPLAAPQPSSSGSTISDVFSTVAENLGRNGYQTGVSLVVMTIAIVAMLNIKVNRYMMFPVAIGAFWAGWLGWNTFTGSDQALFPGDVSSTKLWDVAFTNDTGFLLVAIVACVAAVFLWRTGTALGSRIVLLGGAVLGASFLYNLFEAFRSTPA
jgi:hypothetical protein